MYARTDPGTNRLVRVARFPRLRTQRAGRRAGFLRELHNAQRTSSERAARSGERSCARARVCVSMKKSSVVVVGGGPCTCYTSNTRTTKRPEPPGSDSTSGNGNTLKIRSALNEHAQCERAMWWRRWCCVRVCVCVFVRWCFTLACVYAFLRVNSVEFR